MPEAENYLDLPLEEVIGDRFGRYSKYIIQERALPDAKDGLKPVQRRILYAMLQDNNTADKPFRKAAKTVGNVIGNYHPHGDSSVYEALVRMSQPWKIRHGLVEMQGNNGSIDGDPPAAMRYTEARISALAQEMLRDIGKETVEFIPNFDDTDQEPVVLPAYFPNLLVNGSTGISSGYATDIPPHNLGEVIDAAIHLLENPDTTLEALLTYIKGPDFPGGGTIQGVQDLKQAYETGKGRVVTRGTANIETLRGGKEQIVITEIPYEVIKANLVKRMDEIRFDKKIDGIAEVRDDTDRTGLQIVVELKKEADAKSILSYLYKNTDLQVTYNFNMVAIADKAPRLMGLKPLLAAYLEHQKEVVINRSRYELEQATKRQHIVEGLMKAISVLDELIALIRQSKDKADAKQNITEAFGFSEPQAEAIVNLQLYRLTNTDIQTLEKEAEDLEQTIQRLNEILESPGKLVQTMKKELKQIKKKYANERRTNVEEEVEDLKIDMQVMIPAEEVFVTVSRDGYVKRTSTRSYSASNDERPGMKDTDDLQFFSEMNTTDTLLVFTAHGHYAYIPVHQLPDIRWKDNGQHIGNLVSLDADDHIARAIPVRSFSDENYLLFFTKNGMVKRSLLTDYQAQRFSKALIALKLKDNDNLVDVAITDGTRDVFFATKQGYGLRFSETDINVVGLRAAGVKGIALKEGDEVASALTVSENDHEALFSVSHRGAVKKMRWDQFPQSTRAKRGLSMFRELKTNPHRLVAVTAADAKMLMLKTADETIHPIPTEGIRNYDRYQTGSYVIDTDTNGVVQFAWGYIDHDPPAE
ncbi:DNA topoisomerase IV subunit A [Natribacillus halophilus]|uniref:DNA topoisomerase 4 subunit A n=1 Tax=Natribacillus halophilus TaxID=549003 RepID=A0A1G8J6C9_9BACI|nr:DNA topoisomerase IV subunit A [Natribacillus halophilus]SDI26593.1 DNA topoisomerase IV subunit A [Natribacillus halophilus]